MRTPYMEYQYSKPNGTGFKTRQQIANEYGIDRKTLKKIRPT